MNPPTNSAPWRQASTSEPPHLTPTERRKLRAVAGTAIIGLIMAGDAELLDLVLPLAVADFGADPDELNTFAAAICVGVWVQTHQPYNHDQDKMKLLDAMAPTVRGGPGQPLLLWDRLVGWMREQARANAGNATAPST